MKAEMHETYVVFDREAVQDLQDVVQADIDYMLSDGLDERDAEVARMQQLNAALKHMLAMQYIDSYLLSEE